MKKRRTRQHIIEDLGVNYVEKQALIAGYVLERLEYDYGYDGIIHTFDENGEVENGEIMIQIKSTDSIQFSKKHRGFAIALSKRDLETWLKSYFPMLLILYDAKSSLAYFIDLQAYFEENRILLKNIRKFIRVYLSPENDFTPETVKKFRLIKNELI